MFIDAEPDRDPPSVRRAMFIDAAPGQSALRQEGNVYRRSAGPIRPPCPPDGGRIAVGFGSINMALLTEGGLARRWRL